MADNSNNLHPTSQSDHSTRRRAAHLVGLLALLAPLSYLVGRFGSAVIANKYLDVILSSTTMIALGALLGIPIGLFFGTFRQDHTAAPAHRPLVNEADILAQIKHELEQIKAMFDARKGNVTVIARIEYPVEFWNSIKASGQLFVMSNPRLLNVIGSAYYWAKQANRIEKLAYEAQYAAGDPANQKSASQLVAEARLLDGPLQTSLDAAIAAIDSQAIPG